MATAMLMIMLSLIFIGMFGFFIGGVKLAMKLLFNSLIGYVVLSIINIFGANIPVNFATTVIVGFFGVPGVIVLIIAGLLGII